MEGILISLLFAIAIGAILIGVVYFALDIFTVGGQPRKLILGGCVLLILVWLIAILLGAAPGPRFG